MPHIVLCVDWDETITTEDTLSILAPNSQEVKQGPNFYHYQAEYVRDHERFVLNFGDIKTKEDLLRYVKDVKVSESETISKVVQGGLFAGTYHTQRLERLNQVKFRHGWARMAEYISQGAQSGELVSYVVSVNWSKKFIAEGLRRECDTVEIPGLYKPGFSDIFANELEEDAETGTCTGRIVGPYQTEPLLTGYDKLSICEKVAAKNPDSIQVYVGDSLTDWPCLLWADVGILMGSNSSLLKKLHATNWHQSLCPVEQWLTLNKEEKKSNVVHAKDWNEVQNLLHKLHTNRWES